MLTSVSGESGFDKVLETALHDTYEEIGSFVPDKELINLLRLQYDFSNVKVMLKMCIRDRPSRRARGGGLPTFGSCAAPLKGAELRLRSSRSGAIF